MVLCQEEYSCFKAVVTLSSGPKPPEKLGADPVDNPLDNPPGLSERWHGRLE